MARAVGIDLGTTFSEIAVMEGGQPKVIPSAEGGTLFPSVVAMSKTGERLVGQLARRQAIVNPENTIYSIKRFMGRKWGEPATRELPVEEDARRKTYKVTRGPNNEVRVHDGRQGVPARRNLGDDPPEAEGRRRSLPRREGHRRRHHRAGLLQRRPAPGHQGCRRRSPD